MPKYKNKIKCKTCGDIIESKYRHDYKKCKCGLVAVDGGEDYCRRSFPSGNPDDWFEEIVEEME